MLAAGTGITLTAAHIVIFAELNWNPSNLTQAEDRAHRIGQTQPVQIYYLIASKTADDYILTSLRRKMRNLDAISLNTGSFEGATTSKEETSNKITNYFESLIEDDNRKVIQINPRRSLLGVAADSAGSKDVVTIDENSGDEKDDFDDDIVFIDEKKKERKEEFVIDEWDDEEEEKKKKDAKEKFSIDEWDDEDSGEKNKKEVVVHGENSKKISKKDNLSIDEWDDDFSQGGKDEIIIEDDSKSDKKSKFSIDEWDDEFSQDKVQDSFSLDEWDDVPKSNSHGLKRPMNEPDVVPLKKQR